MLKKTQLKQCYSLITDNLYKAINGLYNARICFTKITNLIHVFIHISIQIQTNKLNIHSHFNYNYIRFFFIIKKISLCSYTLKKDIQITGSVNVVKNFDIYNYYFDCYIKFSIAIPGGNKL